MKVTVVGLGKIGLPLAVQFAKMGKVVLGADINPETIDKVNRGVEPFPEEENLQEFLSEVVSSGNLHASTNTTECVAQSNVVVVVVPLFVDNNAEPDFRSMDAATEEIAKGLKKGTLVAYETTLPIGTTRNRFTKKLEEISRLKVGQDFHVVFSPERVLTGRVFSDLRKYPKIVGGITDDCTKKGVEFYSEVLDFDIRDDLQKPNGVWMVANTETAEFVKLAETTYRDVNIGLANQFALHAEKVNVNIYDVIDSANSQPFSFIHQPGVAVGGHCIPVYPNFYLTTDLNAEIVRQARTTNLKMPTAIVGAIEDYFGEISNLNVLILGLSYRQGVKETYASGAFQLKLRLENLGASVSVFDRLFTDKEIENHGFQPWKNSPKQLDAVIVQNGDPSFFEFLQEKNLTRIPIFDGRHLFKVRDGFNVVYQLGNPTLT
jgi:UDP-N-acetyl-D-glucosamine dehydrogenase